MHFLDICSIVRCGKMQGYLSDSGILGVGNCEKSRQNGGFWRVGCKEKMLSGHEISYTWVGFVGGDVLGDLT